VRKVRLILVLQSFFFAGFISGGGGGGGMLRFLIMGMEALKVLDYTLLYLLLCKQNWL